MSAAEVVLAAGGITALNEAVFAPVASGGSITANFNWRIVPATAGLAVAMFGLEKIAPKFATGLAYLVLAGALLIKSGNADSPVVNVSKAMGYSK